MKIATVIGARPQFVKAAVLSRELREYAHVHEVIIHTGQHYDDNMSAIFFEEMSIPKPDYHLGIGGGSHGQNTGRMIASIEEVLYSEHPDLLLVYGDTDSTLAGALAAVKCHIPVAHVEAGLRSFNMAMPEEINRVLTDRISKFLFCPTETAVNNLEKEGFRHFDSTILQSGDIMYDAALFYAEKASKKSKIIQTLNLSEFILCTVHRQETTDNPEKLQSIFEALVEINSTTPVVIPLHPRTKKKLKDISLQGLERLTIIDPVGYFDMLMLIQHCKMVMTDSGGLQKEAYFFKKPCLTLREETEWVELVNSGHNILVGCDKDTILANISMPLTSSQRLLYGLGKSGKAIAALLCDTCASKSLLGERNSIQEVVTPP